MHGEGAGWQQPAPLVHTRPWTRASRLSRAAVAEPLSSHGAGAAVLLGGTRQSHTQGMSWSDHRLPAPPAPGCLDQGVQDPCPSRTTAPSSLGGSTVQHAGTRSPPPFQKCHFRPFLGWMQPHFLQQPAPPRPGAGWLSPGCQEQPAHASTAALEGPARSTAGDLGTLSWAAHPARAPRQPRAPGPAGLGSIAPRPGRAASHEWAPAPARCPRVTRSWLGDPGDSRASLADQHCRHLCQQTQRRELSRDTRKRWHWGLDCPKGVNCHLLE